MNDTYICPECGDSGIVSGAKADHLGRGLLKCAVCAGDNGRDVFVRRSCPHGKPMGYDCGFCDLGAGARAVAQQDPDADLWRRLQAMTGIGELPDTVPMLSRESIVALLEGLMRQLADWQAGAIGAATIVYTPRVGPHTDEAYHAHRARYTGGSEAYREGADMVAAAVQNLQPSGDPGWLPGSMERNLARIASVVDRLAAELGVGDAG